MVPLALGWLRVKTIETIIEGATKNSISDTYKKLK